MAKKIAETPILKGKDAERFIEAMKSAETKKVTKEERQRIRLGFEIINSIIKD